jgi:hypothetical protein
LIGVSIHRFSTRLLACVEELRQVVDPRAFQML